MKHHRVHVELQVIAFKFYGLAMLIQHHDVRIAMSEQEAWGLGANIADLAYQMEHLLNLKPPLKPQRMRNTGASRSTRRTRSTSRSPVAKAEKRKQTKTL